MITLMSQSCLVLVAQDLSSCYVAGVFLSLLFGMSHL
jgi:hypothetical protein